MSEDYRESRYYGNALEVCPWKDTDHLGERRDNYCTWCEGWVAGREMQGRENQQLRALLETVRVAAKTYEAYR